MGFFDLFRRKAGAANIAEAQSPQYGLITGQGVAPAFSPKAAVDNYKSWVYVAMSKNATAIAGQRLRLFASRQQGESLPKIAPYVKLSRDEQHQIKMEAFLQKQKAICTAEEIVEICDHPFLELMHRPNPFRSGFQFMEQTKLWLDGTGNDYWYIVTGTGMMKGIPVQLWTLDSTLVNIVPDPKTFIKGYMYGQPGKREALRVDEIVHHRMPALRDRYYGMGRIEGMWQAVHGYQAIEKYEAATAEYPVPTTLIKYLNGNLTPKQRRELTAEWGRLLNQQAQRKSNLAGVADSSFQIEKLSFSPKEMQMLKGREFRREEIIAGHGQSMALYTENPNRANIEGAIYIWGRYELDPSLTRISEKINAQLLPMYEGGDRLFCSFEKVAKEDEAFLLKQDETDAKMNIRTRNEIRARRNLPPVDDPRADDLFYNATPHSLGDTSESDDTDQNKNIDTGGSSDGLPGLINGKQIHPTLKDTPIWIYP